MYVFDRFHGMQQEIIEIAQISSFLFPGRWVFHLISSYCHHHPIDLHFRFESTEQVPQQEKEFRLCTIEKVQRYGELSVIHHI
jgi:hypothetical protein